MNYLLFPLPTDHLAKEGAAKILSNHWEYPEDSLEKAENFSKRLSTLGETISKGQGSIRLRKAVLESTTNNVNAISPSALREAREINKLLFEILQLKRFGLALHLKEKIKLSDGNDYPLECFHEAFTLPMLASSLEMFAKESKDPSIQQFAIDFEKVLANALYCDNLTEENIEKALREIHNEKQTIPILIGSGWDWHSTQVIFFQGHILFCNRGSGAEICGWQLFKIGNKEKMTPEWIKNLAGRMDQTSDTYLSVKKMKADLEAELVWESPMKSQRVGNCTYTGLKAAMAALMALWEINPHFENQIDSEIHAKIQAAHLWKSMYKAFSNFDRQIVLSDFLLDLKAAAQSPKPDQSVLDLSRLLHEKLAVNPLYGFKIGWKLWSELVNCTESIITPTKSIPQDLKNLALQFANDEGTHDNPLSLQEQLYKIIESFPTQEKPVVAGKAISLLLSKGQLKEAEQFLNFTPKSLPSIINISIAYANSHKFEDSIRVAKLIPYGYTKDQTLEKICAKMFEFKEVELLEEIIEISLSTNYCSAATLICEKLCYEGSFERAKAINDLIPNSRKFLYLKNVCLDLIKKGNFDLAKSMIKEIPNASPLKEDIFSIICLELFKINKLDKFATSNETKKAALEVIFKNTPRLEKEAIEKLKRLTQEITNLDLQMDIWIKMIKSLANNGEISEARKLAVEVSNLEFPIKHTREELLDKAGLLNKANGASTTTILQDKQLRKFESLDTDRHFNNRKSEGLIKLDITTLPNEQATKVIIIKK